MRSPTPRLVLILLVLSCGSAFGKEPDWHRYENDYFVAWSDASRKKTLRILNNLEFFRVAAFQVTGMARSAAEPRIELIIVRSSREYSALKPPANGALYATTKDGRLRFVVDASIYGLATSAALQHEYAHVLFDQSGIAHPFWYVEGMASLLSMIQPRDRRTAFAFGEYMPVCKYGQQPYGTENVWNEFIAAEWAEDWGHHQLRRPLWCQRFLQSSLLAHYITLGNDVGNTAKYSRYLRLISQGQSPTTAFEGAFGMSANMLWRRELRTYAQRHFVVIIDLLPDLQLSSYLRSAADTGKVEFMLDEITTLPPAGKSIRGFRRVRGRDIYDASD